MFYVYVLQSTIGEMYIGFTTHLRRRVSEHNLGRSKATKNQRWRIVYYEACLNEGDARRREHYFKTTGGRRSLRLRLQDYLNAAARKPRVH
ncbi:MAG TPA: GIY-YIG nuclease family protein [Candidatus Paceibacterota bacterium]